MTLSAAEQYMLELINRARLDPVGEAALNGIDLNQGLTPGKLGTQVRGVLAPNADLEDSATGHSKWMLDTDTFSHTGKGGSSPFQRMKAEGYVYTAAGENISWRGNTGKINADSYIDLHHSGLFKSAGHRMNILNDSFREIGIGQEVGVFTYGNTNYNASMVTQNFGKSGSEVFVTGVAYSDTNKDGFYSIGEGRAGINFAAVGQTTLTAAAGGYAIKVAPNAAIEVSGKVGTLQFSTVLDASLGNVKLDVVNGDTFFTSADITLKTGINNARLLGMGDLDATGNANANQLTGNGAANILTGMAGADTVYGGGGTDRLLGGAGDDQLWGDLGNDVLFGGEGADKLNGGGGVDRLNGDLGADILTGGAGADAFVFTKGGGADRVVDLTREDRLLIDNEIWGNTTLTAKQVVAQFGTIVNKVAVLDFHDGQTITLAGFTKLAGLDAYITII